jgi:hypothetical protein
MMMINYEDPAKTKNFKTLACPSQCFVTVISAPGYRVSHKLHLGTILPDEMPPRLR